MAAKRALIMHPSDNVATSVDAIQRGDAVAVPCQGTTITLEAIEPISFGFKIALADISAGALIRKYGETIGTASRPIAKGEMVHIHNLDGTRARGDLAKGRTS